MTSEPRDVGSNPSRRVSTYSLSNSHTYYNAIEANLTGRQNMGSKGRKNEKKPKKQAEVKKQVGKAPDNSGQKKKF
jgi:hypothetical protein